MIFGKRNGLNNRAHFVISTVGGGRELMFAYVLGFITRSGKELGSVAMSNLHPFCINELIRKNITWL
jgi:hypothetical protein